MTALARWLSIIGIGEDAPEGLSPAARTLIAQAALVVGGRRHLDLVAGIPTGETMVWPSPPQAAFPAIVARRGAPVCVVASGDPFFYGIGPLLAQLVPPEEMICLPGASSFGLAAGRLGWALQDCALVTLHGRRLERIIPHLQPHARILTLTGDQTTPGKLANLLVRDGFGDTSMTICERLGGPHERLTTTTAAEFALTGIDPLNVVALALTAARGARIVPRTPGLPDDWFEHDGQLTKQDIRAATLAALAPRRGELLWDIGAGAGSIGIEWMLTDPSNRAIAIERNTARVGRIARNAADLGVPDLVIVEGVAPAALRTLPRPDVVFIGGGLAGTIDAAWEALPSNGRIVANSVTIETQAELIHRYKAFGGTLKMIQVAQADPVGGFTVMHPSRPVTQWVATKP